MSLTRPPRTSTTECSCRLCPSPGMYAVISLPLVRRTRAIFRIAEFGLRGVLVVTRVHTPRLNGELYAFGRFFTLSKPTASAPTRDFVIGLLRAFLVN